MAFTASMSLAPSFPDAAALCGASSDHEEMEMEGNFSVACADHEVREMAVSGEAGQIQWAWAGQFRPLVGGNYYSYSDIYSIMNGEESLSRYSPEIVAKESSA